MTEQDDRADTAAGESPVQPDHLEQVVDDLEDRVVGHRVDQERHEDDVPDEPAFEQDLDSAAREPGTGAGAEPSS